jgi:aminopeptidase N
MKKLFCLIILYLGYNIITHSQIILKKPASARLTGYDINAKLDTWSKTINGRMKAFWVNTSNDKVKEVQLHLYLNAFRNSSSTFMKESGLSIKEDPDKGWIELDSITNKKGADLTRAMKFISPDDGNPEDMTVLRISLPDECKPKDTVFLNITFRSKLPGNINRTGYSADYFFAGQWFPKFGVYEKAGTRYSLKGEWNCHQFHRDSEFYADHSLYNVKIELPINYVVATSGILMNEAENGEISKTLSFRAEDIVDFAWTAWPDYAVFTDKWKNIGITLLLPPERKSQAPRQLQSVKNGLEYLDNHVGPYPWPHITVVDPPSRGSGAAGMEYTTLFTTSSVYGVPESIHIPETTTIHELTHAYFMGIIANNEFEEPWLDEGITTYFEGRIVDHYYGINSGLINLPFLKFPVISGTRMSYVNSDKKQLADNSLYSWQYPHNTYTLMAYSKPALVLHTLEGIVGTEVMDNIFREYYNKWAFRHPSGKDFIAVANKVSLQKRGEDLNWFFKQTIYGTDICDYKVAGIKNHSIDGSDSLYYCVAQLERTGGLKLPVEVLVSFNDGSLAIEKWDGENAVKDFTYSGNRKIVSVKIDPGYKNKLDVNYINNSISETPEMKSLSRINLKLVAFLQILTCFFSI